MRRTIPDVATPGRSLSRRDPCVLALCGLVFYACGQDSADPAAECAAGGDAVVLASGLKTPGAIAVDDEFVYVGTVGAVARAEPVLSRVPKGGGASSVLVSAADLAATVVLDPLAIAADGTHVYFTTSERDVVRVPKAGGAPEVVVADRPMNAWGIVVDDDNVYWAENTTLGDGAIVRAPKGGGSPVVLAGGQWGAMGLLADATRLYWAASSEGWTVMEIRSVAKAGGEVVALSGNDSGALGVGGMIVDDGSFYSASGLHIERAAKGGGDEEPFVDPSCGWIDQLAADASHIYWLEYTGAVTPGLAVRRAQKSAASPETLVWQADVDGAEAKSIAVDAMSVFWLDTEGGTLFRAGK